MKLNQTNVKVMIKEFKDLMPSYFTRLCDLH